MDERKRALRAALRSIPIRTLEVILQSTDLTDDEKVCLIENLAGANRIWLSNKLHISDRTVDRTRASALEKLMRDLDA